MSLFADYISERENKGIIEDANGFASFYKLNDSVVYVEDVYVVPTMRKKKVASGYVDKIVELSKGQGFKSVYTTVKPSANGSTDSLHAILNYGFKLKASDKDAILFEKEI
jgi:hypothetical protein